MKPRRGSGRLGALVGAPPADVLAATTGTRAGDPALLGVERALRTAAAVEVVPAGWHWPRWLDRQLRPQHPAFVPPGATPVIENVTGRDWCYVGTVGSGWLAMVDPRGAVEPAGALWSLDWLVRAEDRWHPPSREAAVRQRALGGAPVPETSCRIAGGDVVQRVFGATAGGELGDVVVIEVENTTALPIAIAFAIRPAGFLAAGSVSSITVDGSCVSVDGRAAVLFERAPARSAFGDATADSLDEVLAERDDADPIDHAGGARDPLGLANAAFVVPLPHRATVRVVLPVHAGRRCPSLETATLPDAAAAVRGWDSHGNAAATIDLPDERAARMYAGAVRALALASGGGTIPVPHGREDGWRVADEVRIVRALYAAGMREAASSALRHCGDELALDGWFRREGPSLARNAAIFHAVGDAWVLGGDRGAVDALLSPVMKAAHWCERLRTRRGRQVTDAEAHAVHGALRVLAEALRGVDQPDAAQDVAAFAARFVLDHDSVLPRDGGSDLPSVTLPAVTGYGLDTLATVDGAIRLARQGDERTLVALGWLSEVARDRGRWPTFVHPRLGSGSAGCGDDPLVAAAVVELVRGLAVRFDPDSLALLPVVPAEWFGRSMDVRDLPTPAGTLSYSVRWHGERPALLWELDRGSGRDDPPASPCELRAPGLDPSFSTSETSGEVLLAAAATAAATTVATTPTAPGASFT